MLDDGIAVTAPECEDALSWEMYCTGGYGENVKWMFERWMQHDHAGLLPDGEWLPMISAKYMPRCF